LAASTTVSLVHLGCARNLIDSELILARLAEEGLLVSGDPQQADVVVLNTCSFIGPAREESERAIDGLVRRKQKRELRGVVVAGCLVQRYRHELEGRFPGVDVFAEISDYRALARAVKQLGQKSGRASGVPRYLAAERPGAEREGSRMLATPGSYAYLRVSHGCDHVCAFCAIPAIRGPHRSKRPEAIEQEARELIEAGVKELVLVAEDLTAWGRDVGLELPALVERLAELEGEHELRLMYAYPNRFPWELTRLLREHPRVLPYLDIPIQHAATNVLRAMKRAGSGEQVRATLERLRAEVPGIELRTTVLLGFPGETEADAQELVDFVREGEIARLGAFTWSAEEGTSAFELPGRVDPQVANERRDAVLRARDAVLERRQRALVGRELLVLVDESHATRAVGRTRADAPEVDLLAVIEDSRAPVGARVRVRVTATDEQHNLICAEVAAPR
jgi:ribosomal protein S12 methylthiotransferase